MLNSAEQLFALHGLESVSIRDVTESADTDRAAIHYHLGSKADLVAAIFHRRAETLGQRRSELLTEIEGRDDIDLWDLAEAMVRPTAELAADVDGGRYYVAFLTALGGNPDLIHVVIDAYEADTQRIQKVFSPVTPDLPQDVRMLRYAIVQDLINRVLGQPDGQLKQWLSPAEPPAPTPTSKGASSASSSAYSACTASKLPPHPSPARLTPGPSGRAGAPDARA